MHASYKKKAASEAASADALEDFTPADMLMLPDKAEAVTESVPATAMASASEKMGVAAEALPEVTMPVSSQEDGPILIPDFSGKTMREVTEMCLGLGLDPYFVGSGLAVEQVPAAAALMRRGSRITVQFGTPPW